MPNTDNKLTSIIRLVISFLTFRKHMQRAVTRNEKLCESKCKCAQKKESAGTVIIVA